MALDTNGIPEVTVGNLTVAEQAIVNQSPEQPEVTFSSVVRAFMDLATANFYAVVDWATRKMYLAEDDARYMTAATNAKLVRFTPDSGQSGRSLTWTSAAEGTPNSTIATKLAAVVSAVKPRISVESLIARLASDLTDEEVTKCLVKVNQEDGTVEVLVFDTVGARISASAAVDAVSADDPPVASGKRLAVVELSEPVSAGELPPKVFEGGEIE